MNLVLTSTPNSEAIRSLACGSAAFTASVDSTLAALLGVSMPDLEAKLATFFNVLSGASLSEEQKRKVWATVFAIKQGGGG